MGQGGNVEQLNQHQQQGKPTPDKPNSPYIMLYHHFTDDFEHPHPDLFRMPPTLGSDVGHDVQSQLAQKDAQVEMLQKKLIHYRSWVSSIHARIQQLNPQIIKNARRLYVGGITRDVTEEELKNFICKLLQVSGGCVSPGSAVISCKITPEKNYAFIEFRTVEETSNAMALDGVYFKDTYIKIRRPSNYDINTAIMLGPTTPDPTIDTSKLDICRTVVEDSPHKLFIGGLPCDWTDEQVKELLIPLGQLQSFNLVMDKQTGKSKGYAFCEFNEDSATEYAISKLNGRKIGNKVLTVKRALEGSKANPTNGNGSSTNVGNAPTSPRASLTNPLSSGNPPRPTSATGTSQPTSISPGLVASLVSSNYSYKLMQAMHMLGQGGQQGSLGNSDALNPALLSNAAAYTESLPRPPLPTTLPTNGFQTPQQQLLQQLNGAGIGAADLNRSLSGLNLGGPPLNGYANGAYPGLPAGQLGLQSAASGLGSAAGLYNNSTLGSFQSLHNLTQAPDLSLANCQVSSGFGGSLQGLLNQGYQGLG